MADIRPTGTVETVPTIDQVLRGSGGQGEQVASGAPVQQVVSDAARSIDGRFSLDNRPSADGQPQDVTVGNRTVALSDGVGIQDLGVDHAVPASIAEMVTRRVEQRLDVVGEARNQFVDRLTTAGAVQELLGGLAFRSLTPSERIALADSLGQLNETVYREVAQVGEFRAFDGRSVLDDLPPEMRESTRRLRGRGVRGDRRGHSPEVDFSALGNGLPSQVVEALQGLSPVVTDLVGSGADVGVVARQLDLLRDAVIDGVTSQALPGVDGRALVQAREDLATLWDGYLAQVPQEGAETLTPLWSYALEGTRTGSLPAHLGPMVDELGGAMALALRDQVQQAAQPSTEQGQGGRTAAAAGPGRCGTRSRAGGTACHRRCRPTGAGPDGGRARDPADLRHGRPPRVSGQELVGVGEDIGRRPPRETCAPRWVRSRRLPIPVRPRRSSRRAPDAGL